MESRIRFQFPIYTRNVPRPLLRLHLQKKKPQILSVKNGPIERFQGVNPRWHKSIFWLLWASLCLSTQRPSQTPTCASAGWMGVGIFGRGTALDAPSIMCAVRCRRERMPQEHRTERVTGARFIRRCMTHMIDATAALLFSIDRAQRTPPGKGAEPHRGGMLGLRPRTSPKP